MDNSEPLVYKVAMSKSHDQRSTVKLWPKNKQRLGTLAKRAPHLFTINKLANTILALSLHTYEKDSDYLFKEVEQ